MSRRRPRLEGLSPGLPAGPSRGIAGGTMHDLDWNRRGQSAQPASGNSTYRSKRGWRTGLHGTTLLTAK